jgi:selenocysteine lyase/cysteine desulfurase
MSKSAFDPTLFGRRAFLKGASSAAVLTGLTGKAVAAPPAPRCDAGAAAGLQAPPAIDAPRGTEGFWRQLRRAFVLPPNYIHMNTGTTGSQPAFSLNNLAVYNRYKSADPRDWQLNLAADFPDLFPHTASLSATTQRQAQVAAAYGANQDEIVLSYNTTDACNLIFAGTPWKPGDRIVTTSMEHPALAGPVAWARDHHGVAVAMVEIPSNFTADITVDDVLDWFEAELSRPLPLGAKQYLAISEIFYKNGLRMPVKELCDLARSHGAYSIVDTAHGWGMLPIDCHDYGADFIAGAGHKWLCGGPGTGIFYVRRSGSDLPPFAMGNFFLYGNPFTAPSANFNSRNWAPSTFVQLRGETNTPALFAMTDSLRLFEYAGIDDVYQRGVALGNYLKDRIARRWGAGALWVQKNPDPRFATFLTSFNPFAARNDGASFATMSTAMNAIVAALAAESPKIYIRTITWRDRKTDPADNRIGLRISTHAMYNDRSEINHLIDRLDALIAASGLPLLA